MNSDSHYLIGHSHQICEDYALSGKRDGFHYAIISDGCSSSDYVDIGARILAKTAENVIREFSRHLDFYQSSLYDVIGDMIITNAQKIVRGMGLPDTSLDATLMIALCKEEKSDQAYDGIFYVYGDGVCAYTDHENKLHKIEVEYKSGAPLYLSYRLDQGRYEQYLHQFGLDVEIKHTWPADDDVEEAADRHQQHASDHPPSIHVAPAEEDQQQG